MSNSRGGGAEDRSGGGRSTSIPTPKMEIPKESKSMQDQPHHWWSDLGMFGGSRSAGSSSSSSGPPLSPTENVRNRYYSASSSEGTSYGSPPLISHEFPVHQQPSGSPPDPKVAIPLPAPGEEDEFREFFRRSSLKNMYVLDDFATPP